MYGHFRQRLGVKDRRQEEVMQQYLDAAAHRESGLFVIPANSLYARVWWHEKERVGRVLTS